MARPTDPSWATGTVYPTTYNADTGILDPWSGQPIRNAPSSGRRATGAIPDVDDPAEEINYMLGNHGDYLKYLQVLFDLMYYGDGSEGDLTLASGSILNLADFRYFDTLILGSNTVKPNGWPILCKTEFFCDGNTGVLASGGNGTGSAPGAYAARTGPHACAPAFPASNWPDADLYGRAVFHGLGGSGGHGGAGTGKPGNAGATINSAAKLVGRPPFLSGAPTGTDKSAQSAPGYYKFPTGSSTAYQFPGGSLIDTFRGGGHGGYGGGDSGSTPGAYPGAPGPLVVVCAPKITIAGSWVSNGGDGAPGTGGVGGGGGAGGGAFLFVCEEFVNNGATFTANPGNGGIATGGGSPGTSGTAGNTTPYVVLLG